MTGHVLAKFRQDNQKKAAAITGNSIVPRHSLFFEHFKGKTSTSKFPTVRPCYNELMWYTLNCLFYNLQYTGILWPSCKHQQIWDFTLIHADCRDTTLYDHSGWVRDKEQPRTFIFCKYEQCVPYEQHLHVLLDTRFEDNITFRLSRLPMQYLSLSYSWPQNH